VIERMAPQVGLEPTTLRLTAGCSAIELLRSIDALPTALSRCIVAAGSNCVKARRHQLNDPVPIRCGSDLVVRE
jgi:aspartate ammonia-lyase